VDGRVVSSDVVCGDLRSPRTTPLDTTRSSTIFYRLLLNGSISQKTLEKLSDDGNILPKYVGATIHNKLNE
jgi:hypothetical protein